jgi:hypothetical protein
MTMKESSTIRIRGHAGSALDSMSGPIGSAAATRRAVNSTSDDLGSTTSQTTPLGL